MTPENERSDENRDEARSDAACADQALCWLPRRVVLAAAPVPVVPLWRLGVAAMRKTPRILDLFCKAGGAGKGYADAGFEVVGVDIEPQPNYPFEFRRGDAVRFLAGGFAARFDAIHASPPCQAFTAYRRRGQGVGDSYPDLIGKTRGLLKATGLPYVIENVEGAPLENPVMLCGTGFGLDVQRHRLFESNVPMFGMPCSHGRNAARFTAATNRAAGSRRTVEVGVWRIPLDVQQRAMGIDWMTLEELSEAIPPRVHALPR
jgi:DNA (cytosine-5)-methyltransferase 1